MSKGYQYEEWLSAAGVRAPGRGGRDPCGAVVGLAPSSPWRGGREATGHLLGSGWGWRAGHPVDTVPWELVATMEAEEGRGERF